MSGHTPWRYIEHKTDRPWTKLWKRFLRWRYRGQIEKRKQAVAGRATSGYLSSGERARLFRQRRK